MRQSYKGVRHSCKCPSIVSPWPLHVHKFPECMFPVTNCMFPVTNCMYSRSVAKGYFAVYYRFYARAFSLSRAIKREVVKNVHMCRVLYPKAYNLIGNMFDYTCIRNRMLVHSYIAWTSQLDG